MTVEEGMGVFRNIPTIASSYKPCKEVGLDYMKLGQSANKHSRWGSKGSSWHQELNKRSTGRTLYLLDEPSVGLHWHDLSKHIEILSRLVDSGNTVVIIEHNLDIIKVSDWIIDMGPEGGDGGGQVVVAGTPEQVAECETSYTGKDLKKILNHKIKVA